MAQISKFPFIWLYLYLFGLVFISMILFQYVVYSRKYLMNNHSILNNMMLF